MRAVIEPCHRVPGNSKVGGFGGNLSQGPSSGEAVHGVFVQVRREYWQAVATTGGRLKADVNLPEFAGSVSPSSFRQVGHASGR